MFVLCVFLLLSIFNSSGSEPDTTAVPPSDPVRPGDSVTLQCSVLSDSETKTCPGGHSVCCLKDGSDVDSSFNYIQENPEGLSTEKCTYGFFRNVSSSDAATCCCAVATCVETVCGTRSKPDTEGNRRTFSHTGEVSISVCSLGSPLRYALTNNCPYIL